MENILRASASSVVTAASSAAAMIMLVVATRSGQVEFVAAFTAGMAATAIAAAVFGAGTSLSFANGTCEEKSAVLAVRFKFVLPVLVLCSFGTAFAYFATGPLSYVALLCGGLSVAFNNLSEIEASHLQSRLRTVELLFANVASRVLGVVLVVFSLYHFAMVAMAFVYLLLLRAISRRDGSFPKVSRDRLSVCVRMAVKRSFLGATLLESLNSRLPYLVSAMSVLVVAVPELPSLLSVQQGVLAVIVSVIFTTMTYRSGSGEQPKWMRLVERLTIVASLVIAILLSSFAERFLLLMGLEGNSDLLFSWYLLVAALPLAVWNRKMQYSEYSIRHGRAFVARLCFVLAGIVPCCAIALYSGNPLFVAGAWLLGETLGALFTVTIRLKRSRG